MDDLKQEVLISVNTTQKDEDGKSDIFAEYSGVMYIKNESIIVFYTEYSDDGEKTAECRLRINGSAVEIKRSGAYSSRLVFEYGKQYKTMYTTPYGAMPMSVRPSKVVCAVDQSGGKVILDYKMNIGGKMFENSVLIRINNVTKGINNEI